MTKWYNAAMHMGGGALAKGEPLLIWRYVLDNIGP